MHIVLATGIFAPDIGGPATYVRHLSQGLLERGMHVTVVTYGEGKSDVSGAIPLIRVSRRGGPFLRWSRYALALRRHARDADIIYAFSSISCGVPLWMSHLKVPRRILRLGGDFLWERYTDRGGAMGLREWYAAAHPRLKGMMNGLLKKFDHIVFSTSFQEELYEKFYTALPLHSVIQNALPKGVPVPHTAHVPVRLLFLGRFVPFKNLGSLIVALKELPDAVLTLVGNGPLASALKTLVAKQGLDGRVTFLEAQSGDQKQQLLLDHDLLVLPSYTELSPNTALEARSAGLPVLLSEETGLSRELSEGMLLRPLRTPGDIVQAVSEAIKIYPALAERAAAPLLSRTWDDVAENHLILFQSLL